MKLRCTYRPVPARCPGPAYSSEFAHAPALACIAITVWFARYAARRAHRLSFKVLKHLFAALPFGVGMSFLLS